MAENTKLTWYGQSGFKIVTPGGKTLLVDPWLTNPVFKNGKDELAALKDIDLILLSHGHSDHVGNAVEIGEKTGAKLVANADLSAAITSRQRHDRAHRWTADVTPWRGNGLLCSGMARVDGPER
jgi:L-ascorbate metabolism protein UlaG (beta-lactamase superfamily)